MEVHLPFFPLNLVAFPQENLNLHIFEPRYKQLMQDVLQGDRRFGIISFVTEEIKYGTEVLIEQVVRVYPDGRMDIRTVGDRRFRVTHYQNPLPDRLYAGGKIEYLEDVDDSSYEKEIQLKSLIQTFFAAIQLSQHQEVSEGLRTFEIAHRLGLSAEQKYELLQREQESERQQILIDHLERAIPLLQDVEKAKDRVRMNGHFRHFDPLTF